MTNQWQYTSDTLECADNPSEFSASTQGLLELVAAMRGLTCGDLNGIAEALTVLLPQDH